LLKNVFGLGRGWPLIGRRFSSALRQIGRQALNFRSLFEGCRVIGQVGGYQVAPLITLRAIHA
jgi:hypothetical protein